MDIFIDFIVFYVMLFIFGFFIIGINGLVIYLVLIREYFKIVINCCFVSLVVFDMFLGFYVVLFIIICNFFGIMNICVVMDLS